MRPSTRHRSFSSVRGCGLAEPPPGQGERLSLARVFRGQGPHHWQRVLRTWEPARRGAPVEQGQLEHQINDSCNPGTEGATTCPQQRKQGAGRAGAWTSAPVSHQGDSLPGPVKGARAGAGLQEEWGSTRTRGAPRLTDRGALRAGPGPRPPCQSRQSPGSPGRAGRRPALHVASAGPPPRGRPGHSEACGEHPGQRACRVPGDSCRFPLSLKFSENKVKKL